MRCWWGSASPPAPPSAGSSMPSCPQSVPTTTSRGCAPRSSFLQSSVGDGSAVCQIGINHRLAAVLSTSVVGSAKFEAKGKSSSSAAAAATKRATTTTAARGRGKAVKKVYSLSGQKFDPQEGREPLRIFYESLPKKIPTSEMAEF